MVSVPLDFSGVAAAAPVPVDGIIAVETQQSEGQNDDVIETSKEAAAIVDGTATIAASCAAIPDARLAASGLSASAQPILAFSSAEQSVRTEAEPAGQSAAAKETSASPPSPTFPSPPQSPASIAAAPVASATDSAPLPDPIPLGVDEVTESAPAATAPAASAPEAARAEAASPLAQRPLVAGDRCEVATRSDQAACITGLVFKTDPRSGALLIAFDDGAWESISAEVVARGG
eukprot:4957429-Pleurochrysis_carterae.AAC.1